MWARYLADTVARHPRRWPSGCSPGSSRSRARGHADGLRPRRRGEGGGGGALRRLRPPRRPAARPRPRSSATRSAGACSTPTSGRRENRRHKPGRAFERTVVPLRRAGRLRRLPRSPAPPAAHPRVAAPCRRATAGWWATRSPRWAPLADWTRVMDGVGGAPRRAREARARRGGALCGGHGLSRALLHGAERARGHARARAAHRAAGASGLSPDLPGHAPAHRRAGRPRRAGRRDALRGLRVARRAGSPPSAPPSAAASPAPDRPRPRPHATAVTLSLRPGRPADLIG